MSVWQLLDIITPNNLRDAHFCLREECCSGEIQVRVLNGNKKDEELLDTICDQKCEKVELGWKEQKKEFWYEKGTAHLNERMELELLWLKGRDYSGDCPGRVMDIHLNIHPLWIVKTGLGK